MTLPRAPSLSPLHPRCGPQQGSAAPASPASPLSPSGTVAARGPATQGSCLPGSYASPSHIRETLSHLPCPPSISGACASLGQEGIPQLPEFPAWRGLYVSMWGPGDIFLHQIHGFTPYAQIQCKRAQTSPIPQVSLLKAPSLCKVPSEDLLDQMLPKHGFGGGRQEETHSRRPQA